MGRVSFARPPVGPTAPAKTPTTAAPPGSDRETALLSMGLNPATLPSTALARPSAPVAATSSAPASTAPVMPTIDREAAAAALGIDPATLPKGLTTASVEDVPPVNKSAAVQRHVEEIAAAVLTDAELAELLCLLPAKGQRDPQSLRTLLVCATFLMKNPRASWSMLPSALTGGKATHILRNQFERLCRNEKMPVIAEAIAKSKIWRPERRAEFAALILWIAVMQARWDASRLGRFLKAHDGTNT